MLNHPRRVFVALSLLVIGLGVGFIPTLLAQRVAQKQDAPLKTVTLDGKGGTNRSPTPQAESRPRPLTRAQRFALFRGKVVTTSNSFTLSPRVPNFQSKAWLGFYQAESVLSGADLNQASLNFENKADSSSLVRITLDAKVGQLYALDITVDNPGGRAQSFIISNPVSGVTQSIPAEGYGQHITAYVTAEQDGWLVYEIRSSRFGWRFFSVEVTEL